MLTKVSSEDPISAHLRDYFENLPKVIVAYSYRHCVEWAYRAGIRHSDDVIMISTTSYESSFKLMGLRLHREQVFIYETAWWGKHVNRVLDELECRYVD